MSAVAAASSGRSTVAATPRTSAVESTSATRRVASVATSARRSASCRSGFPGDTTRGDSKRASFEPSPAPASPATNHTGIAAPGASLGRRRRISRRSASGTTGVCQAFGPSRLPMWPMVLKVQRACCQGWIIPASRAASAGAAVSHSSRTPASGRQGAGSRRAARSAARYRGLTPWRAAACSGATVPARSPSRSASSAARHFSSGSRPPALVSKAIPWRFTLVAPVFSVVRA